MCSNYRPTTDMTRMRLHFGAEIERATSPPEVWPLDQAPVIKQASAAPSAREAFLGQYGLLPHWAKDPTLARKTYNARSETAAEKPSFRDAWRRGQRCIIPADCIFEPSYEGPLPVRWRIMRADGAPMGIAGLWSRWWASNGTEVMTFAMLTVNADEHAIMRRFHKPDSEKRMVVVLDDTSYDQWLNSTPETMSSMMTRYPAKQMRAEAAPLPKRLPA